MSKQWTIYLSGEIHSDWRQRIENGADNLPVTFTAPVTDHAASDNCGVDILGPEENSFWKDHKGAQINAIRTRTLIRGADVIVVRFGDQYRQWNAAFDAGFAVACNKPLIVLHPAELQHALKEVDAAALAVANAPEQVVEILRYVICK
ncbi:MAG: YtoQ family protein [Gemmatimonadetes bacterium]|jgi:YtoQ family protein|nr:YtoQ family protein [Gemmatimonadota bacterium]MDE0965228.1 YtoQ family protein [Candidatus Latescibacterota bacterium]MBT5450175.1 YtoQ family protein [Gemmatimonadota bacterium]MBT5802314.1 YtoQ family protein [Gemmatimonadota bacterium]MBT6619943.1 YtoQ family protein [Gemmatimonadota bacterium]|tara:strand:- start:89 stop:532 length:444 start_codon:yes stop_codon:yes gene_type:complete